MSPDLRLRLHATQAQPCFPAASNALALPGGNGIFTATPAERITHYTLLRKVVCQMGALPPLETPTRKGGTLPLHGAHTAFSCYPALRLYWLSKSPRGIDVVSLTLGNSRLPLRHGRLGNADKLRQLLLGDSPVFSVFYNIFRQFQATHAGTSVFRYLRVCDMQTMHQYLLLPHHTSRIPPFQWSLRKLWLILFPNALLLHKNDKY